MSPTLTTKLTDDLIHGQRDIMRQLYKALQSLWYTIRATLTQQSGIPIECTQPRWSRACLGLLESANLQMWFNGQSTPCLLVPWSMWHREAALQSFPRSLAPSEPLLLNNLEYKRSEPKQSAWWLMVSTIVQKYCKGHRTHCWLVQWSTWHYEATLQGLPKSIAPSEQLWLPNLSYKWVIPPQRIEQSHIY